MATIEDVVHIGERLRRLREERALRLEDLAKLADALKVDPAELVRGE